MRAKYYSGVPCVTPLPGSSLTSAAGGCICCVSILAPVGTALIGLSAGQAIEWDFPDGAHRRLRVDQVIHHDCPINAGAA